MTDLQVYPPDVPPQVDRRAGTEPALQRPHSAVSTASPIRRYVAALLRFRWFLALAFVVGLGGAVAVWRLIQPDYAAQGSLWVSSQSGSGASGPISQGGLLQSFAWIELIRSFAVLDPVVVDQRLYLQYASEDEEVFDSFRIKGQSFRPGEYELTLAPDGGSTQLSTAQGVVIGNFAPGGEIGADLGFAWTPPVGRLTSDRPVSFTVLSPRAAAVRLRESMVAQMAPRSSFIQLQLTDRDPNRAAAVLESVLERTVDLARGIKRSRLDETNLVLSEQLRVVEDDLRQAEEDLESFRVETITLPSDESSAIAPGLRQTRGPVFNEFFELRLSLEDLQRNRERLEEVLAAGDEAEISVATLELIPAVRGSSDLVRQIGELGEARAVLRGLLQRYTDEHEAVQEVRELIADLTEMSIPRAAEVVLDDVRTREASLERMIASRSEELEEIPPRVIEEARLARRVNIANALYVELRQRFETSSLASRSSVPDLQILDRPLVPTVPQGDERVRWAFIAFSGVFLSAMGLVFLLDRVDPRLRDPLDVTDELGLAILGAVPQLRTQMDRSENHVREAFRELRVNVDYAHGAVRPLVLCVTSPATNEGKSFVSARLAIAFAGLGRRTLLLDGDTRCGNAHELLDLERKPGLTDFLLTSSDGPAHLQRTKHDSLWLLSCGARHAGSPELLNSRGMLNLLAAARQRFDVIIIDTPPLGAGADAFVLAAHAGSLALVLRSGATNKDLARVKIDPLFRLPVRILGAVLNDYVPNGLHGNYRYYGGYLDGYEVQDEVPARISAGVGADPAGLAS